MPGQQLLPLQNPNPLELFSPGGLADLLDRIETEARSIVPDTSTDKGRKAIASIAARVSRSKVYLDDLGKNHVAVLKKQAAAVDAERRVMRDRLDALKAEVRKPLVEWEEAEKARIQRHEIHLERMRTLAADVADLGAAELRERLNEVTVVDFETPDWEEFAEQAEQVRDASIATLSAALARRETYEAEQAELARLRTEAAERQQREAAERAAREQKEREERIAREAEERAKTQAEAAARAQAERVERERHAEIERANKERIDAERRAAQAEERARMATEQERARADAEAAARKAEDERRAADVEHRRKVNADAASALMRRTDISSDRARAVVAAIARGDVPGVRIHY